MDTKTASLWTTHRPQDEGAALGHDLDVDVAIIGAGITGLTAALRLSNMGKRVVVLEAGTIGSGVTSGTSAHLTEAVDARYQDIAKQFGAEAAKLVAQSSRAALDHIAAHVEELDIACDLQRVPGYLYTEKSDDQDMLAKEHHAARAAGLNVELGGNPGLPFPVAGALRFADQMRFLPLDYVLGLARALRSRGVAIYEHTRVHELKDGEPVVVTTDADVHVRAGAVFCATHMPLNVFLVHPKLGHYQSYVAAFPGGDNVEDALFFDTADPYHYTRRAIVDGKSWLVVGGEDHKTGEEEHTQGAFERLRAYAHDHFGTSEPGFHWSAQVIESVDGLPFIGRNAASKHVYVATGFGGNGLTFGTASALIVADLISGIDNPWSKLYDATRMKLSSIGEVIRENAPIVTHLLERADVKSAAEIARGQGRTLKQDGHYLAVYRDPQGSLHGVSARCTHTGCVLAFNDAERTWDCPCHGSRFDTQGKVLEGPAYKPLEQHEVKDA